MAFKLGEKEIEVKVTARSIFGYEKENGTTIQKLLEESASGNLPQMGTVISLIKHATSGLKEADYYDIIDQNSSVYVTIVQAYSEWFLKAFPIAESGNS